MEGLASIVSLFLVIILKVFCIQGKECSSTSDIGKPLILTPYIKNGSLETAKKLSKFKILGWTGYAGYFTVNEKCNGNLFAIFVPAKNNPKHAPLFLWINGGPSSSSMVGFLTEIGPFEYTEPKSIKLRKVTWNDNNNIIYIDQPVGTGFSFPTNSCLADNITVSTEQLYSAMVQFYKMFPEYQKNKLYLTGQSFAGTYLPPLAVLIHNKNHMSGVEVKMNLAGTMIGNPSTRMDCRNYAPVISNFGLVNDQTRDVINERHLKLLRLVEEEKFMDAYNYWSDTNELVLNQINVPDRYNVLSDKEDDIKFENWLDTPEARCLLNVGEASFSKFNEDVFDKYLEEIPKSVPYARYVETLLKANYTVIFYSGNMDLACPTSSTNCLVQGLEWWGADNFRKTNRTTWYHNGKFAGHRQIYGKLAFVIINGAGHIVPRNKPSEMYNLIKCINFPCKHDEFCHLNTTAP